MTPLAALALAVRDRLTAGAEAPLPGIGTLACAHVSARVRVGPDGQRVMLPPGESVGLLARPGDPTDLAQALARHAGEAPATAAGALRAAVDQLDARLAITGDARLDGIGVFQRTSSGVRFAAAPELLAAVNRPYEGLVPVPLAPAPAAPAPAAPAPAPPPVAPAEPSAPVPDSPPGAVDILLDLIVNEPSEATSVPEPLSAPTQSAFADDVLPGGEPEHRQEGEGAPEASPEPEESPPDEEPAGIAVPFGDEPLQGRVPPTPAKPAGEQADLPTESRAAPLGPPAVEGAEPVREPPPTEADVTAEDVPPGLAPDLELAAMDAAVAGGAEPPRTSEPPAPVPLDDVYPADSASEPPAPLVSPAVRSAHRGWAFLYAATVLSLAALVLYWFMAERHPRVVASSARAQPAAQVRPAPLTADSLTADSLALDSLATGVLFADSLAAPSDSLASAAGRP